jgi:hypothetical protein
MFYENEDQETRKVDAATHQEHQTQRATIDCRVFGRHSKCPLSRRWISTDELPRTGFKTRCHTGSLSKPPVTAALVAHHPQSRTAPQSSSHIWHKVTDIDLPSTNLRTTNGSISVL